MAANKNMALLQQVQHAASSRNSGWQARRGFAAKISANFLAKRPRSSLGAKRKRAYFHQLPRAHELLKAHIVNLSESHLSVHKQVLSSWMAEQNDALVKAAKAA